MFHAKHYKKAQSSQRIFTKVRAFTFAMVCVFTNHSKKPVFPVVKTRTGVAAMIGSTTDKLERVQNRLGTGENGRNKANINPEGLILL